MSQNDDLHRMRIALFGTKPDESDGAMARLNSHSITLYGTEENPGGIAKDVRIAKRYIGMASASVMICSGLLVVMQFINKVVPILKGLGY